MNRFFFGFTLFIFLGKMVLSQAPVEGDELIKALGQRESTNLVSKLNSYIGEDFEEKGVQIIIAGSKLTRVDLYNDENVFLQNMKAFKGKLPLGLELTSTIFQAKNILKEGYEEEGNKGGSYTLTKEYPLNDLDAWQLNIMYNRGRLNLISLIYVEKGRANAENVEMEARTGLSPEDYFDMIRKNQYNFQVKTLLGLAGRADYESRFQRVFLQKGLMLVFSRKNTIDKIVLYSEGQNDTFTSKTYKQYPYALPFGLKFSDSRTLAQEKCGPAQEQNGNALVYKERNTEMQLFFSGGTLKRVEIYKPIEE